jgi:hypothetical protein
MNNAPRKQQYTMLANWGASLFLYKADSKSFWPNPILLSVDSLNPY